MKQAQITAQRQTTSPATIISSKILQCSTDELYDYIDELAQENPVIDMDSTFQRPQTAAGTRETAWQLRQNHGFHSIRDENDRDRAYSNELWDLGPAEAASLSEHLTLQLKAMKLEARQLEIAVCVVNSLDENGFFTEFIEPFAERLGRSVSELVEVLEIMQQQLEPAGVCAFDMRGSLCLQIDRVNGDPMAKKIVTDHLDSLLKDKPGAIGRALKLPRKRVVSCCQLIKRLDPYPCRAFSRSGSAGYIYSPDIIVSTQDGLIQAEIPDSLCPQFGLSTYYLNLRESCGDREVSAYLDEKIQQAQWVQRCIENRRSTLSALAGLIIKRQADFFLFGEGRLQALTLAEAAREIGVHESSVSRIVRSKYLQCSHGLFPLSYFFPSGVRMEDRSVVSSCQIKAHIKKLVDEEDKSAPLNDRIIADILDDLGMGVSRRTVAKYREAMGIDTASGRRRGSKCSNSQH